MTALQGIESHPAACHCFDLISAHPTLQKAAGIPWNVSHSRQGDRTSRCSGPTRICVSHQCAVSASPASSNGGKTSALRPSSRKQRHNIQAKTTTTAAPSIRDDQGYSSITNGPSFRAGRRAECCAHPTNNKAVNGERYSNTVGSARA